MRRIVLIALTFVTSFAQAATIRFAADPKKSVVDYLGELEQSLPAENIFASSYSLLRVAGKLTVDLSALNADVREPLEEVLKTGAFALGDLTVDLSKAQLNFILVKEMSAPRVQANTIELLERQQAASEWCGLRLDIGR